MNFLPQLPSAGIILLGIATLGSCNTSVSKSDVQDDLKDAQEATQKAQEETQEAQESQAEFYADTRATKVKELEDRSDMIDERIVELRGVSNNSSNQAAQGDIASAVQELQDEKEALNERISEVKSIKEEDWNASYEEISTSIGDIEGKIDTLAQSLESNN